MPSFDTQAPQLLQTLLEGYRDHFKVQENWQLGDATLVAMAQFLNVEEKFLLVRSVKMRPTEAQEIVMFFIEPEITGDVLDNVEKLIGRAEELHVDPKDGHAFTILTAVLLSRIPVDKTLQKRIKRYRFRKDYQRGKYGWSLGRIGVMDVDSRSILTNKDGHDVSKVLTRYSKPKAASQGDGAAPDGTGDAKLL